MLLCDSVHGVDLLLDIAGTFVPAFLRLTAVPSALTTLRIWRQGVDADLEPAAEVFKPVEAPALPEADGLSVPNRVCRLAVTSALKDARTPRRKHCSGWVAVAFLRQKYACTAVCFQQSKDSEHKPPRYTEDKRAIRLLT